MPCPPPLTAILRRHFRDFGYGPGGRLFVGERNQDELPISTINRIWRQARVAVFTPEVAASPLAETPYDLRHAAVSTQLNGASRRRRSQNRLASHPRSYGAIARSAWTGERPSCGAESRPPTACPRLGRTPPCIRQDWPSKAGDAELLLRPTGRSRFGPAGPGGLEPQNLDHDPATTDHASELWSFIINFRRLTAVYGLMCPGCVPDDLDCPGPPSARWRHVRAVVGTATAATGTTREAGLPGNARLPGPPY